MGDNSPKDKQRKKSQKGNASDQSKQVKADKQTAFASTSETTKKKK